MSNVHNIIIPATVLQLSGNEIKDVDSYYCSSTVYCRTSQFRLYVSIGWGREGEKRHVMLPCSSNHNQLKFQRPYMNQNWPNTHTYTYSPIPSLLESTGVSVWKVPVS